MNKKHDLIISLKEAEMEYDLCYFQMMKTLNRFKRFAEMKELAEDYIKTKRIIKSKLKSYNT